MIFDPLDKRILAELDSDSRITLAELARKSRCSIQTAKNRVTRLIRSGVIKKFHASINTACLGLQMFELYLKLRTPDAKTTTKMITHLNGERSVTWTARFSGYYDLGCAMRAPATTVVADVVDRLVGSFGALLSRKSVQMNIRMEYLSRNYLSRSPRPRRALKHLDQLDQPLELDLLDRHILFELGNNSRLGATEIAAVLQSKGVSCTRETVQKRIGRMEREGPIAGGTIVLDHSKINQQHYKLLVFIDPSSVGSLSAFIRRVYSEPRAVYLVKTLGEWDYEIDIEVENQQQLNEIVTRITSGKDRLVKDYTLVEVAEIHKYSVSECLVWPTI